MTPENLWRVFMVLVLAAAGVVIGCAAFDLRFRHGGSELELHTPGPGDVPATAPAGL